MLRATLPQNLSLDSFKVCDIQLYTQLTLLERSEYFFFFLRTRPETESEYNNEFQVSLIIRV